MGVLFNTRLSMLRSCNAFFLDTLEVQTALKWLLILSYLLLNLCEIGYRWRFKDKLDKAASTVFHISPPIKSLPLLLISCAALALPWARTLYLWASLFSSIGAVWLIYQEKASFSLVPAIWKYRLSQVCIISLGIGCLWTMMQPVFIGAINCAKLSTIYSNMNTLQTMVETFHSYHGRYPNTITELKEKAMHVKPTYWKKFVNPITGSEAHAMKDYGQSSLRSNAPHILGLRFQASSLEEFKQRFSVGQVLYQRTATTYRIYGVDNRGELSSRVITH